MADGTMDGRAIKSDEKGKIMKQEECICGLKASHKIVEETTDYRHPFTAYLCCDCFRDLMGQCACDLKKMFGTSSFHPANFKPPSFSD